MPNSTEEQLTHREFFRLVHSGLLETEYSPWNDQPMLQAIGNIIATNFTSKRAFLNATDLQRLHDLIPTFTQDDIADRTISIYVVITLATVATVALRFYSRRQITGYLKPEDWCAAVALFFSILTTAVFITLSVHGSAGKHIWQVSWMDARRFYFLQMACALIFKVSHLPVKATFLLCYYALLPPGFWRKSVIVVFLLVSATTLTGLILVTFKCQPVDFWNDMAGAKCVNKILVFNIWGIFSVAGDVLVLILPMPVVWKLELSLREKILVTGVFGAGGLCVIASVNRLLSLDDFYRSPDITYTICKNLIWTLLEVHLGLMISCVPALRAVINPARWRACRKAQGSVAELSAAAHLRGDLEGGTSPHKSEYFVGSHSDMSREDLDGYRSSGHGSIQGARGLRPPKVYRSEKILPDAGVVLGD